MNKFIIIALLSGIVGIALFLFGIITRIEIKKITYSGIKTRGVITKKEKKQRKFLSGTNEYSSVTYSYEIKYKDFNQNIINKTSDFENQTDLKVGNHIELYYDKDKTDKFILFPERQLIFSNIFILIGVLSLIISISIIYLKIL